MLKAVIFDWGDTLMRDFPGREGPMVSWPVVEAVEGVVEALALDRSLTYCVASNAGASDAHLMGLALERVGIRQYFDHLFTSKELGAAKPDVRFFTGVAERLGVAPGDCLMVGNDYDRDIVGAKQAGLLTAWQAPETAQPVPGTHVLCSMAELPGLIHRLRTAES